MSQYVAEDQHLWEQQQLDVKVQFIAGVGAINAVIAGSTDFSMSSGGSLTRAASHGEMLLAIANMGNHNGQNMRDPQGRGPAGHFDPNAPLAERAKILKGKTIGIDAVGSWWICCESRRQARRRRSRLRHVSPMQLADTLAAFTRHSIDGFAGGPPFVEQVVTDGTGVVVADGVHGEPRDFDPIGSVMVITRPDFCKQHRSICRQDGSCHEARRGFHP